MSQTVNRDPTPFMDSNPWKGRDISNRVFISGQIRVLG
ncbi:Uncharacterised protein [Vibrio cholerae]|nr:Uncharacterised protein [Vibrio cholerae]